MSNPTTPFGWQMPEPTDLVTDLPADFEVFGQAVATDLQYLLGGTTGQVLAKASGTDLDFDWISSAGDIEGVTAGVGITGGGTTGTVTITNDMATTITAAGDIVVGTGSGTYDNLPIGTTAQVLTADTTVSPYKVKWAAASSPAFVGCFIHGTGTTISVGNNVTTAMALPVELYDTNAFHSTTINTSRITIPAGQAGYYLCLGQVDYAPGTQVKLQAQIQKNGGGITATAHDAAGGDFNSSVPVQGVFYLDVADYVELFARQLSGGAINAQLDNQTATYFSVAKIG